MVSPPIPPCLLNDDGIGKHGAIHGQASKKKKKKMKMSKNRTDQTIPDCPPDVLFSLCNRASFPPLPPCRAPKVPVVDSRLLHLSRWVLLNEARKAVTVCCASVTTLLAQTGRFVPWARTPKDFCRSSTLSFHSVPRSLMLLFLVITPSFPISFAAVPILPIGNALS